MEDAAFLRSDQTSEFCEEFGGEGFQLFQGKARCLMRKVAKRWFYFKADPDLLRAAGIRPLAREATHGLPLYQNIQTYNCAEHFSTATRAFTQQALADFLSKIERARGEGEFFRADFYFGSFEWNGSLALLDPAVSPIIITVVAFSLPFISPFPSRATVSIFWSTSIQ